MNVDQAQAELHAAGWSTGDSATIEDGKLVWHVYCHRGNQKLVARNESRANAWAAMVKMAAEVL